MTDMAITEAANGEPAPCIEAVAADLLALIARAQRASDEDPFGNPVLSVALSIARRIDNGLLDDETLWALVRHLRDAAFADRARRLAAYVGGADRAENEAALVRVAGVVLRPDPSDSPVRWAEFREAVERTRYAAVFTAHPTFALPGEVAAALAAMACGAPAELFPSHRPHRITLEEEFTQASAAIVRGRDALDQFNAALLAAARGSWPDRWTELTPRPLIMTDWVGYDTDGRTDIGWLDIVRLRLRMKRLQLERLAGQLAGLPLGAPVGARIAEALTAVAAQEAACPALPHPPAVAAFARELVGGAEQALHTPEPLLALFAPAIAAATGERRTAPVHHPRRAGRARAVAGAHPCAAERGAGAQCGAPAPGHRRPAGGPGAPPRAARRH